MTQSTPPRSGGPKTPPLRGGYFEDRPAGGTICVMFSERFIDTGEVRVRMLSGQDDGPPVLFLHGVSRTARDFAPLFPSLLGSWHVHALDHRGHGQTLRTPGAYRVLDYARDAVAAVRSLTEPVILYGHSLGAVVAAAVAASEPDLVRAAVLEDPPSVGFFSKIDRTPYLTQFTEVRKLAGQNRPVADIARDLAAILLPQPNGTSVRLGSLRDPTALRFSARCLTELDPAVFDPVLDGSWFRDYQQDAIWPAIECPVLLLRGEEARGGMFPAGDADHMAATIPDCTRVDVPGVGHLIHWLATETCVRLTLGFLESL